MSRASNPGLNSVSDGKLRDSAATSASRVNTSAVIAPAKPALAPTGLESSNLPRVVAPDITQGRHRGFMVGVSLAMFISHLPFLAIFIVYMVKREDPNRFLFNFFQGVPETYFIYAIVSTVILFLIIIVPSVLPAAGRSGLQFLLFPLYVACVVYLTAFTFMRQSQGKYLFDWDSVLLPLACGFLYASFGAVITAAMSVRKVPKVVASAVGASGVLMSLLLLWLFSRTTFQQFWAWVLYIGFGATLGFYYAYDMEDMVRKRGVYYRTNDWFLGFIHLHTDPVFRLPRDLLFRRHKDQPEVVQELEVAEPDLA